MSSNAPARERSGPLRFLVIGAGQRGKAYGKAVTNATDGVIHAVAEPIDATRQQFGRNYIWGNNPPLPGQEFEDWRDWVEWEKTRRSREQQSPDPTQASLGVDGVFICSMDETHVDILQAIAPFNLHILCEKPLATSLKDTLTASKALTDAAPVQSKIFAIGHVLRYNPHNQLLRKLLLSDRVIGDVVSIEHTEPVGWSHFPHSYVRGNWRRENEFGDGSLLTKCCHDIDFILWLLCSPPSDSPLDHPPHLPHSISSMGSRTQFTRSRKPAGAGAETTNCLSCPVERECNYSAIKIYDELCLAQGKTDHPINIVCPDIEDLLVEQGVDGVRKRLYAKLAEDYDAKTMSVEEIARKPWYGRCVYESDNNVCDDQFVTMSWEEDPLPGSMPRSHPPLQGRGAKLATIHMPAPTEAQCVRRGRVYGTDGEITYDSETISVFTFKDQQTEKFHVPPPPADEQESHGGGDYGISRAFIRAVDAVENKGWEARRAHVEIMGCTFEEAIRSHAAVFAAEEARRDGRVLKWKDWWAEKSSGGLN